MKNGRLVENGAQHLGKRSSESTFICLLSYSLKKLFLIVLFVSYGVTTVFGQCPALNFVVPDEACLDQTLFFDDVTNGSSRFEWDFCSGDILNEAEGGDLTTLSSLSNVRGIVSDYQSDLGVVAFVIAENNKIFRVSFGDDISAESVTILELTSVSSRLNVPRGITKVIEGSKKYLLIGNSGNGSIIRVDFGESWANPNPSSAPIAGPVGLSGLRGLSSYKQGNRLIALAAGIGVGSAQIGVLDFPTGILSSPLQSTMNVSGAGTLGQVKAINQCGQWYGLVSSLSNDRLYKLYFGNDLRTLGSSHFIEGISGPLANELRIENNRFYGLVSSFSGALWRIDFGEDFEVQDDFQLENLGNLGVLNNISDFSIFERNSETTGLFVGLLDKKLSAVRFADACGASFSTSEEVEPEGLQYNTPGSAVISLVASDANGNVNRLYHELTVKNVASPVIDFAIGAGNCQNNPISFTSSVESGSVNQYEWFFDGVSDGTSASRNFQFSTAGDHLVRLVAGDGQCSNAVEKTVTIYQEVTPTTFSLVGSLCTNNQVAVSNVSDDSMYPEDFVRYNWYLDGSLISEEKAPAIVFTQSGSHEVKVQRQIPGCSAIVTSLYEIVDGPAVDLIFTNACWDQVDLKAEVQFSTSAQGSELSYTWDFGDNGISTASGPTHSYTAPGEYYPVLTVLDANSGCSISTAPVALSIAEDPVLAIEVANAFSLLSVQFSGIDNTPGSDEVVEWSWDFAGLGTSNQQNPEFVFNEQGTYEVTLEAVTSQGCVESISQELLITEYPCPIVEFSLPEEVCKDQNLTLVNSSRDAVSYEWDFCEGDLHTAPAAVSVGLLAANAGEPRGIAVVKDGGWYMFVAHRVGNYISRVSMGSDLNNVSLTNVRVNIPGGMLAAPEPIVIVKEEDTWYGFVHNGGNSQVLRLNFGNSLENSPSVEVLVTGVGSLDSYMKFAEEQGRKYLVVTDFINNTLSTVAFGASLAMARENVVVSSVKIISGSYNLSDMSLVKECDNWYGIAVTSGSRKVFKVSFGESLTNTPEVVDITGASIFESSLVRIEVEKDAGEYIGHIATVGGLLYRLNLSADIDAVTSVEAEPLGTLGVLGNTRSLDLVKEGTEWRGFSINSVSGDIYRLDFSGPCEGSDMVSAEEEPQGVSYSKPGDYFVSLKANKAGGGFAYHTESIHVRNQQSPQFAIVHENSCVDSDVRFTPTGESEPLSTFQWSIENDVLVEEEVIHLFSGTGEFTVRLEAGNGTCTNSVEKTLTIYEAPSPPEFSIEEAICTSSMLQINNASDDSMYPEGLILYHWYSGADLLDEGKIPEIAFQEAGLKEVRVVRELPGCVAEASTQVQVQQGPDIETFVSNYACWDRETKSALIEYSSTTNADQATFAWDFGDGEVSAQQSGTHTYSQTGQYEVNLQIDDAISGCKIDAVRQQLVITDQPLAFIELSDGNEDQAVEFSAAANVTEGDEVTSWTWDFGDGTTSSVQRPTHTFSSGGTFPIALTIETINGCADTIEGSVFIHPVACPVLDIALPGEMCLNEQVKVANNSSKVASYEWDFCEGDLHNFPTAVQTGTIGLGGDFRGMSLVKDTIWHLFATSKLANTLFRISFGDGLTNAPTEVVNLGNPLGLLNGPAPIVIAKDGETWYGFIHNNRGTGLIRLNFGEHLKNSPSAELLLAGVGAEGSGMKYVEKDRDKYLMITNISTNSLITVELGAHLSTAAGQVKVTTNNVLPGTFELTDLSMVNECEKWYAIGLGFNSRKVYKFSFGDNLAEKPEVAELTGSGTFAGNLSRIEVRRDAGDYVGHIVGQNGVMYQIVMGGQMETVSSFDILATGTFTGDPRALVLEKEESLWRGFTLNAGNGTISRLDFPDQCNGQPGMFFTEQFPSGARYTVPGDYVMSLKAATAFGRTTYLDQIITVSDINSTPVDFSIDGNVCADNQNTFTFEGLSRDITAYSWDFDGDGVEDSSVKNPEYQFPQAGTYRVQLEIQNESGCSNTASKTISIYDSPTPDFSFSSVGVICSSNSISFVDLTEGLPPDSLVTWTWDFDGEATVDGKDAFYTFATPGEKQVTLTVSFPGCEGSVTKTIDLKEGPVVGFELVENCVAPVTHFINTSTGEGITSQFWDFGNGYTSTSPSAETFYENTGVYSVSLTLTNDLGCETTLTEEISIGALPEPAFTHDLACSGVTVQFTDESAVAGSNIVSWEWDFAGISSSILQNPEFIFPEPGRYSVGLTATSFEGCSAFVEKRIEVLPAQVVAMEVVEGCAGEAVSFADVSAEVPGNPVIERLWTINGVLYTTPTVSVVFNVAGSYTASLQVTTKNLCTTSLTQTFTVQKLPLVDFAYANFCNNELTEFTDLSSWEADDPIISRQWDFDSQATANGSKAFYQFTESGSHMATLSLITQKGCETSVSKTIEINEAPLADFTNTTPVGQLPLTVNFASSNTSAEGYKWYLGDDTEPVSVEPNFDQLFESEGEYNVAMVAISAEGCSDTVSTTLVVALPRIDLVLRSFNYLDVDGKVRFILSVANLGTIDQTGFGIEISVDNSLSVVETYPGQLRAGQSVSYAPQFELVVSGAPIEKVCIRLIPNESGDEVELSPSDNINCSSFSEGFLLNSPYPNPVEDRLTFELILPGEGDVEISLLSMTGQPVFSEKYSGLKAGLTSISLQMGHLHQGLYMLRIQGAGNEAVRRILKR